MMKYICARILYPDTVHEIPSQSLIGINGLLEYDDEYQCMFIGDYNETSMDICIPITKEQYIGLLNRIKLSEVTNTNLYGFHYTDEAFEVLYDTVFERNRNGMWDD